MKSPWPTKKLGEICRIRTGKKDVDEGNPEGKYPFFTCAREITYSDTYSFDTEAVLVAGNGDVGATKIYKGKFEAYQRTYVLDDFKDNIKYIYYYLLGNLKRILIRSKSGSTMPYIRKGDLENFEISIPEDLKEQQKIVSILDTIQEAIEVQEKIIEKTKELKKSLMADLFKYGAPSFRKGRKLKKTEIGEIPEDWEVVRLGEVFSLYAGGDISKLNYSPIKTGKFIYPIYSNTTENKGLYGFSDTYQYSENCITVTARGNLGYAIPRFEKFNAIIRLLVLVPKQELDIIFVSEYINTKIKVMMENTSIPQLTVPRFSIFKIPLPPLSEQQEIAEILQTIDQKIEIEQKKKALYEELFKTMLNKLMKQEIDIEKINL
ncbi:MAG: restriction endonuclease subunit S [Candidatus Micrarchaeia archaeon]